MNIGAAPQMRLISGAGPITVQSGRTSDIDAIGQD
jgi:hypothetical protein